MLDNAIVIVGLVVTGAAIILMVCDAVISLVLHRRLLRMNAETDRLNAEHEARMAARTPEELAADRRRFEVHRRDLLEAGWHEERYVRLHETAMACMIGSRL